MRFRGGRHDHPVARALKAYAERHSTGRAGAGERGVRGGAGPFGEGGGPSRARWPGGLDGEPEAHGRLPSFKRHLAAFREDSSSSLCVAVDDEVVGLVAYSDGTRPESAAIVRQAAGRRPAEDRAPLGRQPRGGEESRATVGIDEAGGSPPGKRRST